MPRDLNYFVHDRVFPDKWLELSEMWSQTLTARNSHNKDLVLDRNRHTSSDLCRVLIFLHRDDWRRTMVADLDRNALCTLPQCTSFHSHNRFLRQRLLQSPSIERQLHYDKIIYCIYSIAGPWCLHFIAFKDHNEKNNLAMYDRLLGKMCTHFPCAFYIDHLETKCDPDKLVQLIWSPRVDCRESAYFSNILPASILPYIWRTYYN